MPYSKSNGKSASADKVNDIAKELAQTFIDCLKEDQLPWDSGRVELDMLNPYNPKTKSQYAGSSRIILILKSIANGWTDPRFLTFNNAKDLGGFVRKGEHGTNLIRYQPKTVLVKDDDGNVVIDEETGKPKQQEIFMPLPYTVFNVSQIEGIKLEPLVKQEEFNSIDRVDNLIKQSGANIVYDPLCVTPCYRPVSDDIRLPPKDTFLNQDAFYSTLLHELSHWTGHESRLNRGLTENYHKPDFRAQEELTAEIGSSLLCKALGVPHDLSNSKAYIQSWIKELTDKPKEILKATNRADKIATYVLKFEQVQDLTEEKENKQINTYQPTSKESLLGLLSNPEIKLEEIDTSKITDMSYLFANSKRTDFSGIEKWNTSNVTDMDFLFGNCENFNQDISNWDVGKVTNMFCMFKGCECFNQDISKWNVSNVTDMSSMFSGCKNFNQPLNDWNVGNVEDMSCMFSGCEKFNQPLDNWNTQNVKVMIYMFKGCEKFNQPLNNWNVSNVTDMECVFGGCEKFNQPLNDWDVSNVTVMDNMFAYCCEFNQPLNDWCVREDCICNNAFYGSNLSYENVKDAFTELQLENSNSDKIFDEQADIKKAQMAKEKTSSVNVDLDAVKSKLRKATRF